MLVYLLNYMSLHNKYFNKIHNYVCRWLAWLAWVSKNAYFINTTVLSFNDYNILQNNKRPITLWFRITETTTWKILFDVWVFSFAHVWAADMDLYHIQTPRGKQDAVALILWHFTFSPSLFNGLRAHLSSVGVQFLPQQYFKAMVLMQQVKDVRHLIIPANTGQQTHLYTHTLMKKYKKHNVE